MDATSGGALAVGPPYEDLRWMRRALILARRQAGVTWPNPTVGCCIVREGELLAEGVHEGPGEPHAEAAALSELATAGVDPAGCTLYVTLEPCHHQGRTPPCSRAIAAAGVARVVYAADDRTPRHEGGGAAWMRGQGIEVERGPLGALARELNHPFFETRSEDEVHLTLKLALTLDGAMARREGRIEDQTDRAVTGSRVRRRVHRMRAGAGAVLIGGGTVIADHPRLDVRELAPGSWSGRQPLPVVLAAAGEDLEGLLPPGAVLFRAREGSHVEWGVALAELAARQRGIVLVEGGAAIAADLLAKRPPQRIHLYLAARSFGPQALRLPAGIDLREQYDSLRVRRVGQDLEWVLRRRDLR